MNYRLPRILVIPAVIFLLALGTWQVFRLEWKNQLIRDINIKINAAAINFNELSDEEITRLEPKNIIFSKAKISGYVDDQKLIFLYAGPYKIKGQQGYRVFAPVKIREKIEILVDLGWIKKEMRANPDLFLPKNRFIEIEGNIMPGEKESIFTPNNPENHHVWIWIDLPAMREYINGSFPDFYLMRRYYDNQFPLGKTVTSNIRNTHLEYVITWYGLAIALVIIYFYGRK